MPLMVAFHFNRNQWNVKPPCHSCQILGNLRSDLSLTPPVGGTPQKQGKTFDETQSPTSNGKSVRTQPGIKNLNIREHSEGNSSHPKML